MKACDICGKGAIMRGQRKLLRGHYNPTERQRKQPNLQWVRFEGKRIRICTGCLRTISKRAAIANQKPAEVGA